MQKDSLVDPAMFKPPSRVPVIVGTVAGLVLGGVIGAVVTSQLAGSSKKKAHPAESTSASASASASAAPADSSGPAAPAGTSLAARAAAGDPEAKKQLEARPLSERSADEVIALVRARSEAEKQEIAARVEAAKKELAELAHKISLVPKVVKDDKAVAARLKELTQDKDLAPELLRMYTSLPGNTGPDMLYAVVVAGKKGDPTMKLAEELLYAKDVRPKASLELSALLELRKAETCEDVLKALPAVKRESDRRAIVPLMRFENKRGCGDKGNEDCWKCIRDGDLLKETQKAVQKRPAP